MSAITRYSFRECVSPGVSEVHGNLARSNWRFGEQVVSIRQQVLATDQTQAYESLSKESSFFGGREEAEAL